MPATHHSVFLQAGCPSCHPINIVKALKATSSNQQRKKTCSENIAAVDAELTTASNSISKSLCISMWSCLSKLHGILMKRFAVKSIAASG